MIYCRTSMLIWHVQGLLTYVHNINPRDFIIKTMMESKFMCKQVLAIILEVRAYHLMGVFLSVSSLLNLYASNF